MAKIKSRLGRGLTALMADTSEPQAEAIQIDISHHSGDVTPPAVQVSNVEVELDVESILPNPYQPRRLFREDSLVELAESIKGSGLVQPIVVRKGAEGYELIAGERRLRAAKIAGLKTIPVIVRQVDGLTQAQMALVENVQREDLNPIDRANAYRVLLDQLGLTQAELAGRLGEDRSGIANYLRLLDLAEPVRNLVQNAQLSLGHAKILAGVHDQIEQDRLAKLAVDQGLSVRNLERLIQAVPPVKAKPPAGSVYLANLELNLSRQLGLRTQVKRVGTKGAGRVVLHYGSLDQFDDLMHRLGVKTDD